MRLLIVEDNAAVLSVISNAVEAVGHHVVGKAQTVKLGLLLASECACDAAILDVDLCGQNSGIIAERLKKRGIPFLVATGSTSDLAPAHRNEPLLQKPFNIANLLAMIAKLQPLPPERGLQGDDIAAE